MTVIEAAPASHPVPATDWVKLVHTIDQLDETTGDDLAHACGPRGWIHAVNQAAPHLSNETRTWLQTGDRLRAHLRHARITCGQLAGGDSVDYLGTRHLLERINSQLQRWRDHAQTLMQVAYQHAT